MKKTTKRNYYSKAENGKKSVLKNTWNQLTAVATIAAFVSLRWQWQPSVARRQSPCTNASPNE